MKTRTILIGALVAVGLAGVAYYFLRRQQATTVVVPAGSPGASGGTDYTGIASIIQAGAHAFGDVGGTIAGWFNDKDDQKPDDKGAYTPGSATFVGPMPL